MPDGQENVQENLQQEDLQQEQPKKGFVPPKTTKVDLSQLVSMQRGFNDLLINYAENADMIQDLDFMNVMILKASLDKAINQSCRNYDLFVGSEDVA